MKLTVIPENGDSYEVMVDVPKGTANLDDFLNDWMDKNLKDVKGYKRKS